MKKFIALVAVLGFCNAFGKIEFKAQEVYKKLYNSFLLNNITHPDCVQKLKLMELDQLSSMAEKNIAKFEQKRSTKNIFSKILGGGLIAGIATYTGIYGWGKALNLLSNAVTKTDSSLAQKLCMGASVALGSVGGFYFLKGFYDWAKINTYQDEIKLHGKINEWLITKKRMIGMKKS
jgi:hypothetical protein